MPILKTFSDGSTLEYDRGKFDPWCVYLSRPGQQRYAPKDTDYFRRLRELSQQFGAKSIYHDFVYIYEKTASELNPDMFDVITQISSKYEKAALEMDIWLTTIYLGMVAEERKAYTKLGKRVKRLGLHQLLIDNASVEYAANFSRGKGWREIAEECKVRGF